jgi:ABC-type Fe3+ transport system permease subunit
MPGEDSVREDKRRWSESPLRTLLGRRLLGWFLLLALVPLLASIFIGFLRSHQIIEEVLEQSLDAITEVQ